MCRVDRVLSECRVQCPPLSDSTLMTCMVFDRKERHLHFVDGASGGYALAAKQLKGQIASKR
ncbi:MAG: DUF3095 family protein [Nitrospinaceae bacterium]|nr:DUF3095 family protein [Nitrospinaceae bacterium]